MLATHQAFSVSMLGVFPQRHRSLYPKYIHRPTIINLPIKCQWKLALLTQIGIGSKETGDSVKVNSYYHFNFLLTQLIV